MEATFMDYYNYFLIPGQLLLGGGVGLVLASIMLFFCVCSEHEFFNEIGVAVTGLACAVFLALLVVAGVTIITQLPVAIWGDIPAAAKEVVTSGK